MSISSPWPLCERPRQSRGTRGQLAFALFNDGRKFRSVEYYIAVDVTNLPVAYAGPVYSNRYGAKSIFRHPTTNYENLDITGKIVAFGKTLFSAGE